MIIINFLNLLLIKCSIFAKFSSEIFKKIKSKYSLVQATQLELFNSQLE